MRKDKAFFLNKAKEMDEWVKVKREKREIFWLKDFCLDSGITENDLKKWCGHGYGYIIEKALERFQMALEVEICKEGARGNKNQAFIKLALINLCKWKDERVNRLTDKKSDKEKEVAPKSYGDLVDEAESVIRRKARNENG